MVIMEDRGAYKHKKGKYDGYTFRYINGGLEKMTGDPNGQLRIPIDDINEDDWEKSYDLLKATLEKPMNINLQLTNRKNDNKIKNRL